MNELITGLNGLKLIAGLVTLWLAFRFIYSRAVTSWWCEELFHVRNKLWDEMRARGRLDSPAHRDIRERINGLIRVAPQLNVWMLRLAAKVPPTGVIQTADLSKLIEGERDEEVRSIIKVARMKLTILIGIKLFIVTMPGMLVGIPLMVFFGFYAIFNFASKRMVRQANYLLAWTSLPRRIRETIGRISEATEVEAVAIERADGVLVKSC